jgi:NTE family protein
MGEQQKTGLVLTGGGARAGYQLGVLRGVSSLLKEAGWQAGRNPYDIICGTSAGAINATALACHAENFDEGLHKVLQVWQHISAEQVYRADSIGMLRTGSKWLSLLSLGWLLRKWLPNPPNALFDNTPLVSLLNRILDFPSLDSALSSGALHALAITASSYTSGEHFTFFQTEADIEPWVRTQRFALRSRICVEHLLASSAIPLIFPATPLYCNGRHEYFGDGSIRQLAPISPAIHLGADKVLVVGAGRLAEPARDSARTAQYPSLAEIAGHALSGIFLDSLAVDIERMQRVNATVALLTPEQRRKTKLRPIKMLVIAPSERLDDLASKHIKSLPRPVRMLLAGIGATEARGAALASYLLFEASYARDLIRLGERDARARAADVLAFFGLAHTANQDADSAAVAGAVNR